MAEGIILLGLNGCGKTTVGRSLAHRLGFNRLDVEDFYFLPSEIPYSRSRTHDEVQELLLQEIRACTGYVLSCVRFNWNQEIENSLRLAVVLSTSSELRSNRIKQREEQRFGSRVLPGGDMHESQMRFRQFAASRSEREVTESINRLACPVVVLDASRPVKELVEEIISAYNGNTEMSPEQ